MGFFSKPDISIEKFDGDPNLPVVHILHGIHSGSESTGVLAPYYSALGYRVWVWDYGEVYAVNARFLKNPHVVSELKKQVKSGDIGVGHSNGCAILAKASDEGVEFSGLTFINPALNKDRRIEPGVNWIRVYFNEGDKAVNAGKWFRILNPISWFNEHPYGEMGKKGTCYFDKRVDLISGDEPPEPQLTMLDGHSAMIQPSNINLWGEYEARKMNERRVCASSLNR